MIHFLIIATVLCGITMLALFLVQLRTSNAAYVDVGWAYNLGLLALLYAILGSAPLVPRVTFAAMGVFWSLRLGTHILRRVVGQPEEGRYAALRAHWKHNTAVKFFLFFEGQAFLDVLLSLPFVIVSIDSGLPRALSPLQFAAIALFLLATFGESIADFQLERFKATAARHDVCDTGLWRFSRHPNYFFEWLIWIAYAFFATPAHLGWLVWSAPIIMLIFLLKVTGIPYTEMQALRSKGERYAHYQQTTSIFIPWFKKKLPHESSDHRDS
jgi:steroid 5-alpha reductase family enzyme